MLWRVNLLLSSAGRLEYLADIRPLTRAIHGTVFAAADSDEDASAQLSQLTSDNWVRPEFGPAPCTIWP